MDRTQLVATGLTPPQAAAYALLLEQGEVIPAQAVEQLGITRTNAYKVFDRLTELGLAKKTKADQSNKFVYQPDNPLALTNLVAEQRNLALAREEAVKRIMNDLLATYHQHTEQPGIKVVTGRTAVIEAYQEQIRLQQPLHFIRAAADIPVMGFDTMHSIRMAPSGYSVQRHGIVPDKNTSPGSPQDDQRSNLDRTWVRGEDYTAPVEWSACGPTLLIVLFGNEPHAITITSPLIADAFRQLWQLLHSCVRAMPYYNELPRREHTASPADTN